MTFAKFPCKIDVAVLGQREKRCLRTLSSGDRAFGSGPKGRRFESCRVHGESLEFSRLSFLRTVSFAVCLKKTVSKKLQPFRGQERALWWVCNYSRVVVKYAHGVKYMKL